MTGIVAFAHHASALHLLCHFLAPFFKAGAILLIPIEVFHMEDVIDWVAELVLRAGNGCNPLYGVPILLLLRGKTARFVAKPAMLIFRNREFIRYP